MNLNKTAIKVLLTIGMVFNHHYVAILQAKESKKNIPISDETLRSYKDIQKEIKNLQNTMKMYYSIILLNSPSIKSVKKFVEIKKNKKNIEKLKEMRCTSEEVEAVHNIEKQLEYLGLQFKQGYKKIIKTKMDINIYNEITERLQQDPNFLKRYEALS